MRGERLTRAQERALDSLILAEHTVKEAHIYRRRVVAKVRAAGISAEQVKAVREALNRVR